MPEFISTKNNHSFVIIEHSNQLANKMRILYGLHVRLFCELVLTEKNPKGTYHYPDYFADTPNKTCQMSDIIERRPATELETSTFQSISSGTSLSSEQKSFLRNNYLETIDKRYEE